MLVAEPLAWFTGADPAVLDPTEAEFVEADRTLSLIKRANDPGVAMQKHREEDDGRGKPPGGRSPAPPQGDQSNFREEREEPGAAEQAVARRQGATTGLPAGKARALLVSGGQGHLAILPSLPRFVTRDPGHLAPLTVVSVSLVRKNICYSTNIVT